MKAIERVYNYINYKGLSVSQFERLVGFSNGYLSKQYKRMADMGESMLTSILENCPDINPSWLLTGIGEMTEDSPRPVGKEPDIDGQKVIPLIPLEAFAGYPEEQFSDLVIEEYYQISEFKTADFLMRVKGDSMTPKYNGGDLVACMKIKSLSFFQWHRIYAIYTKSQGVLIKRVEPAEDEACIQLFSDNPIYKPFIIRKEEIADIALVLGAVTLE